MDGLNSDVRISAALLPDALSGTVVQAFAHGLNVQPEAGRLFYVGGYDKPLSCIGMQIPAGQLGQLLMWARVGDAVRITPRGLFLTRDDTPVLHLVWEGFVPFSLSFPGELSPDACRGLVHAICSAEPGLAPGLGPDSDLVGALRGLRAGGARQLEAATWLLGRGPGLTPSGDDILSGFGAGLTAAGKKDAFGAFASTIETALSARRTTAVSEAYLAAMLQGLVNEGILELLKAACDGRPLGPAIESARRYGHTSGDDMLLGLSVALES